MSHGVSIRGAYTWSKSLDDGDSLNQTTAGNAPGLASNPFNLRADWGLATYDVRNMAYIERRISAQTRTYQLAMQGRSAGTALQCRNFLCF
jgi:hypothetical protein